MKRASILMLVMVFMYMGYMMRDIPKVMKLYKNNGVIYRVSLR